MDHCQFVHVEIDQTKKGETESNNEDGDESANDDHKTRDESLINTNWSKPVPSKVCREFEFEEIHIHGLTPTKSRQRAQRRKTKYKVKQEELEMPLWQLKDKDLDEILRQRPDIKEIWEMIQDEIADEIVTMENIYTNDYNNSPNPKPKPTHAKYKIGGKKKWKNMKMTV